MCSQAKCAFDAVVRNPTSVHYAHMSDSGEKQDYLREWRLHCGFTLEAAAEAAGMSHSQLSRIERGTSDWTRTTLNKLAATYLCEAWELLHVDPGAPSEGSVIADIYDRIPDRNRQQARQILETFTDQKKA